jgi:hypothetical protein
MPVYGKMVMGEDAYTQAVEVEVASGGSVYGSMIPQGAALVDAMLAAATQAETNATMAPPTVDDLVTDEDIAAAVLRMEGILGASYSVSDAENGLRLSPTIWGDLALAEIGRSETAGARKGIIKALLAMVPEGHEAMAELLGTLA